MYWPPPVRGTIHQPLISCDLFGARGIQSHCADLSSRARTRAVDAGPEYALFLGNSCTGIKKTETVIGLMNPNTLTFRLSSVHRIKRWVMNLNLKKSDAIL